MPDVVRIKAARALRAQGLPVPPRPPPAPKHPIELLKELWEELERPGPQALYRAAKNRGIRATLKQATEVAANPSEKQLYARPQKSQGKTAASEENAAWQLDLMELRGYKDVPDYNFVLVVVDVFTRKIYSRVLKTKKPFDLANSFASILRAAAKEAPPDAPKKPKVVSHDAGNEYKGAFRNELDNNDIAVRVKDPEDKNALAVVDRTIQLLKKKMAEILVRKDVVWIRAVSMATEALNKTPKEVLHGVAPNEVSTDLDAKFQVLQDVAEAYQHNFRLQNKRATNVTKTGKFRSAVPNAYERTHNPNYSQAVSEVARVEGSNVAATSGETFPLKRIQVVPYDSKTVRPRLGDRLHRVERIVAMAKVLLRSEGPMTKAQLNQRLDRNVENYKKQLSEARVDISTILRDPAFKVVAGKVSLR